MSQDTPRFTTLGKLFIVLFIAGCLYGAYHLFVADRGGGDGAAGGTETGERQRERRGLFGLGGEPVTVGIAYGTDKRRWLTWAVEQFADSDEGAGIEIELIPMGSLEGAQALLDGDQRIHVWSPASALYTDIFVTRWRDRHGSEPILRSEPLALSPMVFVSWAQRHQAFVESYGEVSFGTLFRGLQQLSGWAGIAGRPEWGLFKVGHTHPNRSNSGLMTLVLMAYDRAGKVQGLELADILDPDFQRFMQEFEAGVSGLSNSTGNMMRDMVLKGPSAFDVVVVYENVAIDYLKNAEGRWGELRISYPRRNMWNENPYYIIDAPWSSADQRRAAEVFLDFLLSERIQRQALVHGFRPGNPAVPVIAADSPFTAYRRFGLTVDLPQTCEAPRAEVIENLLASWQRGQGRRR